MTFGIQFDFDVEGEPPKVYIADQKGCGSCYIEVFEKPELKNDKLYFSWEDEDWEVGPIAKALLKFMNSPAYIV